MVGDSVALTDRLDGGRVAGAGTLAYFAFRLNKVNKLVTRLASEVFSALLPTYTRLFWNFAVFS